MARAPLPAIVLRRLLAACVGLQLLAAPRLAHAQDRGSDARIVGGTPPTDVLDHFALLGNKPSFWYCGGAVIGRGAIVTAAHCYGRPGPPQQACLGPKKTRECVAEDGGSPVRATGEKIPHPEWDDYTLHNDIALLRFDTAELGDSIAVAGECMVSALRRGEYGGTTFGAKLEVCGFGKTSETSYQTSSDLLCVEVPFITPQACTGWDAWTDDDIQFCAGGEFGKDACQGDSGGPIHYKDSTGKRFLMGVVSYGIGCANAGNYGIYTKAASYLDWFREKVPDVKVSEKGDLGNIDPADRDPTFFGMLEQSDRTPFFALIRDSSGRILCEGVLVHRRYVLTTVRCAASDRSPHHVCIASGGARECGCSRLGSQVRIASTSMQADLPGASKLALLELEAEEPEHDGIDRRVEAVIGVQCSASSLDLAASTLQIVSLGGDGSTQAFPATLLHEGSPCGGQAAAVGICVDAPSLGACTEGAPLIALRSGGAPALVGVRSCAAQASTSSAAASFIHAGAPELAALGPAASTSIEDAAEEVVLWSASNPRGMDTPPLLSSALDSFASVRDADDNVLCEGVLIAADLVLTTAACVTSSPSRLPTSVCLGRSSCHSCGCLFGVTAQIATWSSDPRFDPRSPEAFNFAKLTLSATVPGVVPQVLPQLMCFAAFWALTLRSETCGLGLGGVPTTQMRCIEQTLLAETQCRHSPEQAMCATSGRSSDAAATWYHDSLASPPPCIEGGPLFQVEEKSGARLLLGLRTCRSSADSPSNAEEDGEAEEAEEEKPPLSEDGPSIFARLGSDSLGSWPPAATASANGSLRAGDLAEGGPIEADKVAESALESLAEAVGTVVGMGAADKEALCGGIFVGERYILTLAECVRWMVMRVCIDDGGDPGAPGEPSSPACRSGACPGGLRPVPVRCFRTNQGSSHDLAIVELPAPLTAPTASPAPWARFALPNSITLTGPFFGCWFDTASGSRRCARLQQARCPDGLAVSAPPLCVKMPLDAVAACPDRGWPVFRVAEDDGDGVAPTLVGLAMAASSGCKVFSVRRIMKESRDMISSSVALADDFGLCTRTLDQDKVNSSETAALDLGPALRSEPYFVVVRNESYDVICEGVLIEPDLVVATAACAALRPAHVCVGARSGEDCGWSEVSGKYAQVLRVAFHPPSEGGAKKTASARLTGQAAEPPSVLATLTLASPAVSGDRETKALPQILCSAEDFRDRSAYLDACWLSSQGDGDHVWTQCLQISGKGLPVEAQQAGAGCSQAGLDGSRLRCSLGVNEGGDEAEVAAGAGNTSEALPGAAALPGAEDQRVPPALGFAPPCAEGSPLVAELGGARILLGIRSCSGEAGGQAEDYVVFHRVGHTELSQLPKPTEQAAPRASFPAVCTLERGHGGGTGTKTDAFDGGFVADDDSNALFVPDDSAGRPPTPAAILAALALAVAALGPSC